MTLFSPKPTQPTAVTSLILLTLLTLAGCGSPGPKPPPAPTDQMTEIPDPVPVTTRPSLDLPPSQLAVEFSEAGYLLDNFDWMGAAEILAFLPPTQLSRDDLDYFTYLQSRIAFIRGQQGAALSLLKSLDRPGQERPGQERPGQARPGTHPAIHFRSLKLQQQILRLQRQYIDSARTGARLSAVVAEEDIPELHGEIWRDLQRADSTHLTRALTNAVDPEWRGWLELVLVVRDAPWGAEELQLWRDSHPLHPAAEALPGGLAAIVEQAQPLPRDRVALILPLSGRLGPIGRAVREGYLATFYAARNRGLPTHQIDIYDLANYPSISSAYDDATLQGASLVIGPISKQAVAELGQKPGRTVPVIALNRLEDSVANTPGSPLIQLSLSPEEEATRIATLAFGQGARRALIIRSPGLRADKLEQALNRQWRKLGGTTAASYTYAEPEEYSPLVKDSLDLPASEARARAIRDALQSDVEFTARRRQDVDAIFLLADSGPAARSLKPLLKFHYAGSIPVYATSSIYNGIADDRNSDLDGIYLADIPWLMGSNPGLRVSIAAGGTGDDRFTRLNALGADAYRVQQYLEAMVSDPDVLLRGNTGLLSRDSLFRIQREPSPATFDGGELRAL